MEYVPPPPIDASKVPMAKVHLPNVPVIKAAVLPKHKPVPVKVHPTHDRAPKTKPTYGMTPPVMKGVHGVDLAHMG